MNTGPLAKFPTRQINLLGHLANEQGCQHWTVSPGESRRFIFYGVRGTPQQGSGGPPPKTSNRYIYFPVFC